VRSGKTLPSSQSLSPFQEIWYKNTFTQTYSSTRQTLSSVMDYIFKRWIQEHRFEYCTQMLNSFPGYEEEKKPYCLYPHCAPYSLNIDPEPEPSSKTLCAYIYHCHHTHTDEHTDGGAACNIPPLWKMWSIIHYAYGGDKPVFYIRVKLQFASEQQHNATVDCSTVQMYIITWSVSVHRCVRDQTVIVCCVCMFSSCSCMYMRKFVFCRVCADVCVCVCVSVCFCALHLPNTRVTMCDGVKCASGLLRVSDFLNGFINKLSRRVCTIRTRCLIWQTHSHASSVHMHLIWQFDCACDES